jgi:hypothetical protein
MISLKKTTSVGGRPITQHSSRTSVAFHYLRRELSNRLIARGIDVGEQVGLQQHLLIEAS